MLACRVDHVGAEEQPVVGGVAYITGIKAIERIVEFTIVAYKGGVSGGSLSRIP